MKQILSSSCLLQSWPSIYQMIFTGSLKNNYTFSFRGDFFLLIWICIVLFTILGDKQSCVLQTDKDNLVSYFVKAVNTLFLKNGF